MSLRDRVFAAADGLFLRRLTYDLSVHVVRPVSGGRLRSVGEHLKEWKDSRRAIARNMPQVAREQLVDLAERIFVCGIIVSNEAPSVAERSKSTPRRPSHAGPVRTSDPDEAPPEDSDTGGATGRRKTRTAVKRTSSSVWRRAANPKLAQAVVTVLRRTGYPLWPADINAKLPAALRISAPRRPTRDIPAALVGSKLERGSDRKWWFAGEERPERPKRRNWKLSKSHLAKTRRDSRVVFEGIMGYLRTMAKPLSIPEMLRWARENLEMPKEGNYDYNWLKQLLRRLAEKEPRLVKVGSKYRWRSRTSSRQ